MVSVGRLKPSDADHLLSYTKRIRRPLFPLRLHTKYRLSSLLGDRYPAWKEGFSNMDRGSTIIDLFPMFDSIRLGRQRRYNLIDPFSINSDVFESSSSSSNVRVIPIKVEHSFNSKGRSTLQSVSPKQTPLQKIAPVSVDDEPEEDVHKCLKQLGKTKSSSLNSKCLLSEDVFSKKISGAADSPIFIEDEGTEIPIRVPGINSQLKSKPSSPSASKAPTIPQLHGGKPTFLTPVPVQHHEPANSLYTTKNTSASKAPTIPQLHGGKSTFLTPVPVQHLEPANSLSTTKNINNNSSRKQDSPSASAEINFKAINNHVQVDDIDVDFPSPNDSRKPSLTNLQNSNEEESSFYDTEQEINPAPSYPIYSVLKVKLAKENRKVDYIRGDGNCFFRALSKQLYGTERYHKVIRSLIVDIIATNKAKFTQYVDGDIQVHVENMSQDHCWATTCEIYAAATLLQRDIYMLTPDHRNEKYSWLLFKPVFKSTPQPSEVANHPCYLTLCNTNGNHYDRVVPDHGGCNCFAPCPQLDGVSDSIDLTPKVSRAE